ncbi:MAG: phosphotransferase [Ruminococcus flavefaciens]|nr:phosphotransferase [Ruminococcus flavefaciens]
MNKIIAERSSKIIYSDGYKCTKVFNSEYSSSDVLNEAFNQAMAENEGLSVPKIFEVSEKDGKWSIVSEYIEGKSLAQLMEENPENMDSYLELFVKLQLDVHSKMCPTLKRLSDKLHTRIEQSTLSATDRFALHTRLESFPKNSKLCHSDFNPSNIIISSDGTPYIIDWSHAVQGNASAETSITYLMFLLSNKPDIAEKYIEIFCEKSGTSVEYVKRWIPITATAMAVNRYPERHDFLMKQVEDGFTAKI